MPRMRNWLVQHPLLRKGGVHKRCRSGERAVLKHALDRELDDYMDELGQTGDRVEAVVPGAQDSGDDQ